MSRILMFVYDMIIFLSLFLLVTSKSMPFFTLFSFYLMHDSLSPLSNLPYFLFDNTATVPCTSDKDCPETILHKIWQCIDNFCVVKMTGSMCPGC